MASVFRQELTRGLVPSLMAAFPDDVDQIRQLAEDSGLASGSFEDLLNHVHPPLGLLVLLKEYAKPSICKAGSMPKDVAAVFYTTAICVARLRLGQRITRLEDSAFSGSIRWCLKLPWLTQSTAGVLSASLQAIGPAKP